MPPPCKFAPPPDENLVGIRRITGESGISIKLDATGNPEKFSNNLDRQYLYINIFFPFLAIYMVTYGYNIFEALTKGATKRGATGGWPLLEGTGVFIVFFENMFILPMWIPLKKIVGQIR